MSYNSSSPSTVISQNSHLDPDMRTKKTSADGQGHGQVVGAGEENEYAPLRVTESRGAHSHTFPESHEANDLHPAQSAVAQELKSEKGGKQGGGPPKLNKFSYHFFSPEMAMFRKIALKILLGTTVLTVIVMWLCLPVYWGSLWKANKYTDKLTVRVIDRDGGSIGSTVSSAILSYKNLKFFSTSPSEFPTDALLADNIVNEGAWAAIVINEGATANLLSARQNGQSSYLGSSAITIYYSQARQETAVGTYMLPYIQANLAVILGQLNAQSVAEYLSANSGNATAMANLVAAPSTISNGIFYQLDNLRPYNQPVAAAITLVGLIYMLIFSFVITMTNNAVREIIAPFLTTKAYITYRLLAPLALYFVISFFFAMVNLPFKIHFGAHFTYAGGYFLWWFTLFLGMAAVGLSTEFAITILGPRFITFFLLPLIISNVSVAALPHELQPWIFKYGIAMPFYNCNRVVRTIIFNTKNEIGRNIGILLAWIVVNIITISLATWLARRKSVNEHRKEVGNGQQDDNKEKV